MKKERKDCDQTIKQILTQPSTMSPEADWAELHFPTWDTNVRSITIQYCIQLQDGGTIFNDNKIK